MTVLMHDALAELPADDIRLWDKGGLATLLYADDTLLMGVSKDAVQRFLEAVENQGSKYGLELHWDKFQLLQIRCNHSIKNKAGENIKQKASMVYLGTTMSADGTILQELSRRLGAAWGEFNKLARLWKHTSLCRSRKAEIFQAVVATKLLYGLSAAWLNVAERRRIDGFQARCVRKLTFQGFRIELF